MEENLEHPKINIKFHCGCGFNSDNIVRAVNHVIATIHTVTISGLVFQPTKMVGLIILQKDKEITKND